MSNDDIRCRVLLAQGGRVYGVPDGSDDAGGFGNPGCYHAEGTLNPENGVIPVQMGSEFTTPTWFLDTPNNGGEYKAWITPVGDFQGEANGPQVAGTGQPEACRAGEPCHGFVDHHSKTDNFKIREDFPRYADVTVCKFNDLDGNGTQEPGEPNLAHWLINATGQHQSETLEDGCVTFTYTCAFDARPAGPVRNVATVTEGDTTTESAPAVIDFADAHIHVVDGSVDVTDALAADILPATLSSSDVSPTRFEYSNEVVAPQGTCVQVDNTAIFTSTTSPTTGNASTSVKVCGGVDLTVSKTATTAFTRTHNWSIKKSVDKTTVQRKGGTATFNYTVDAATTGSIDSAWTVSGTISVTNPNDWESVSGSVVDLLADAGGVSTGGTFEVAARSTADVAYTCTFASAPAASGTNTATATWDATAAHTAGSSADGTAPYAFVAPTTVVNATITVTDTFNGTTTTLGTVTAAAGSQSFTYNHTVPNAVGGQCTTYNNTAVITETGQSSSKAVNVCNTATGGLTIGFWQNKNGQAVIKAANQNALRAYLTQYAPFQDLGTTVIATYVTNVIKAANASGASMNAMLKAQMLATALDVFTSTTGLGGVRIDLTSVNKPIGSLIFEDASSSFGPANSLTVSQMLAYAASRSNVGGTIWYNQVKNGPDSQELAKDAFDAINNEVAWIAP